MALYKGEDKIKDIYLGDVPIFKVYAGEEFCGFFTFSHENLIENSDLLIDSDGNGVPDGLTYADATDISLTNGIAKFTATATIGGLSSTLSSISFGDLFYQFCRVKTNRSKIVLGGLIQAFSLPSSNDFIFSSFVGISVGQRCNINDTNTSNWTPIEVDYIGAINITDLVSRGILPSGLTNSEYQDILDNYFNS